MPPHRQSAAPAARSRIALPHTDTHTAVPTPASGTALHRIDDKIHPEDDCEELMYNAMNAISTKRWVSADLAQPSTVQLWVRIFKDHIQQSAMSPDQRTTKHTHFVKYITREWSRIASSPT